MNYDVPLIPQSTNMSCWAASIAMILAWRDQASYDPQLIAQNFGGTNYMPQLSSGLDPNDTYILERNGFRVLAPECFAISRVRQLLTQFGPLWVASKAPAPHIRVVRGMAGSTVFINDPAPVSMGSKYSRSFKNFFGAMEGLGAEERKEPAPVYVAHLMR
jgi:predicted double-glycine peptidase